MTHQWDTARPSETQRDTAGQELRPEKSSHQVDLRRLRPFGAVGATPSVRIFRANQCELKILSTSRPMVGGEEFLAT